jgi:hypothetical protein
MNEEMGGKKDVLGTALMRIQSTMVCRMMETTATTAKRSSHHQRTYPRTASRKEVRRMESKQ